MDLISVFIYNLLSWRSQIFVISSMLQILFVMSCRLILQLLSQFLDMRLKLILVTSVAHVILNDFSGHLRDMRMQFHSINLRVLMISIMISRILFMIINHWRFMIKCINCGLKSLDFNFIFWTFHVGFVKQLLEVLFVISKVFSINYGAMSFSRAPLSWAFAFFFKDGWRSSTHFLLL